MGNNNETKMNRVEIWFKNGDFKAFPEVTKFDARGDRIMIQFGDDHVAIVFKPSINFIELMYED